MFRFGISHRVLSFTYTRSAVHHMARGWKFPPPKCPCANAQVAGEWRVAAGAEPKDWATLRGSAALVPLDIASGVSSSAFVVVDDKNRLSVPSLDRSLRVVVFSGLG